MKLAYFTNEIPYPADHGGRVDTWTRMQAMKAAGAQMCLITWYPYHEHPVAASVTNVLATVTSDMHLLTIKPSLSERLKRLRQLLSLPSHASSRIPSEADQAAIWAKLDKFQPEAVWLDGLYPTVMAQACAKRYGIPMFYRSHNIEHQYMARQVSLANNWRDRIAWGLNLPNLKKIEVATLKASHTFYDCALADLHWWQAQGLRNGDWLPLAVPPDNIRKLSAPLEWPCPYDVAYLGNLRSPNNVDGVLWFVREVWPRIRAQRPGTTMVLAGKQPVDPIKEAIAAAPGITLVENAPDAIAVQRSAGVLVNPIFVGSGVNVKSIEMLFTPGFLISTEHGVGGLADEGKRCFTVVDDAPGFADAVLKAIANSPRQLTPDEQRNLDAARAAYGFGKVKQVVEHMRDVAAQTRRPASL